MPLINKEERKEYNRLQYLKKKESKPAVKQEVNVNEPVVIKDPFDDSIYNTFVYNNKLLRHRCIAFAYTGSVFLKQFFKKHQMKSHKVQVKKYENGIKEDDVFSPYHYYIEIKTPRGKLIMDNMDCFTYCEYMNRFKPRGTITKARLDEIKHTSDVDEIIKNTVMCHINNEKKLDPFYINKMRNSII